MVLQAIYNGLNGTPVRIIEKETVAAGIKIYRYLLKSKLALVTEPPATAVSQLKSLTKEELLGDKYKVSITLNAGLNL